MTNQGTLFQELPFMAKPISHPEPARAHYNDPSTSFEAADRAKKSGLISRQASMVFCAVQSRPGATSRELAARIEGLDRWAVARRLPELVRLGIVQRGDKRRCNVAGTMAVTWWAKRKSLTAENAENGNGQVR